MPQPPTPWDSERQTGAHKFAFTLQIVQRVLPPRAGVSTRDETASYADVRSSAGWTHTLASMTRLVLINGAPGSGKSTLTELLARDRPMTLALDVDGIKHSLGRWDEDPAVAGLHARRLSLALAGEHLSAGYDVVLGQYLARTPFIEDLEGLASQHHAQFFELVLDLDVNTLANRLAMRRNSPERPEHAVNNELVGPNDALHLVESMNALRRVRPRATSIDATDSLDSVLDRLRAELEG